MKIAILIVAAGASTRLGKAKQLLPFREDTLLNHCIRQAIKSEVGDVYIVLGSNASIIQKKLPNYGEQVIFYKGWENGMSSSIAFGVQSIKAKNYDGLIVSVGDQPFLRASHFMTIAFKAESSSLICSKYNQGQGPPSYFHSSFFNQLVKLKGDNGAKAIIKENSDVVTYIDFKKGNIDIDTQHDLIHLQSKLELPILQNDLVKLTPIKRHHFEGLFKAASDPEIWEYHPAHDRYKKDVFISFFEGAINSIGAYVIWDKVQNKMIGSSRFNRIENRPDIVEIGWSFLAKEYWGKQYNLAFKKEMIDYGLSLYTDILFYVDVDNIISQKAMTNLGATKYGIEGTLHYPPKKTKPFIYVINKDNWKF